MEISTRIDSLLSDSGFGVSETVTLQSREARSTGVPEILHPLIRAQLREHFPTGLYTHQAAAIQGALQGQDICLATGTASGKSLVFMSVAASLLKTNVRSRVVCLYPALALIHDQLAKWEAFLSPLNLTVDFVSGEVTTRDRAAKIHSADVVLMTPDVLHAWGMSNLSDPVVSTLLQETQLLVLDEAHVFDGVFGTNMAYFLRRLLTTMPKARIITATATVADPADFLRSLTGREFQLFGRAEDGSPLPARSVLSVRPNDTSGFEAISLLLRNLAGGSAGKFLAFADSRRMVERLVATTARDKQGHRQEGDVEISESESGVQGVLPYRAGYEDDDRVAIERALRSGELAGVVSTSALELGLDIGDIDVVILLTLPPSVKAFWQRVGRAGRRSESVCIVIDDKQLIGDAYGGLQAFLERPVEPNWLYVGNRYIQYAHALCAASEAAQIPWYDRTPLLSLPEQFTHLLENELNPQEAVPLDLYPMKQQATEGRPQYEFPLRSNLERQFMVEDEHQSALGKLTHAQALREAYPGAVYYYMARPYRVTRFEFFSSRIRTRRTHSYSTEPIQQTMVFPRFPDQVHRLWRGDRGFVAETDLQVSERILGFRELRGSARSEHRYGPTSEYSHRDLQRFFDTTGVCWSAPAVGLANGPANDLILEAFCVEFGIQSRDLGTGGFHASADPFGSGVTKGQSIYDGVKGSLRLTEQLGLNFSAVIASALRLAETRDVTDALPILSELLDWCSTLTPAEASRGLAFPAEEGDWVTLVAPGQSAILHSGDYARTVTVESFRYTPRGWYYELVPDDPDIQRRVPAEIVIPIPGETMLVESNAMTGEERPLDQLETTAE